jgi:hypothetical protein
VGHSRLADKLCPRLAFSKSSNSLLQGISEGIFATISRISSLSAQNPQIFRFAEGIEQGITGISHLSLSAESTCTTFFRN